MALKIVRKESPAPPPAPARSRVPEGAVKPSPPPSPPPARVARLEPPRPQAPSPPPPVVGKKLAKSLEEVREMRKKVAELEKFVAQKQAEERKAKIAAAEEREIGKFMKAKGLEESKTRALRAEFNALVRARGLKPDIEAGKLTFVDANGRRTTLSVERLLNEAAKNRFPPVAPPKPAPEPPRTTAARPGDEVKKDSFVGVIKKEFENSGVRTNLLK